MTLIMKGVHICNRQRSNERRHFLFWNREYSHLYCVIYIILTAAQPLHRSLKRLFQYTQSPAASRGLEHRCTGQSHLF